MKQHLILSLIPILYGVLAVQGGDTPAATPPPVAVETAPVIWHVDAINGKDTSDGRREETAFASIQHAVDLAQPGDTVLVHPGIYFENVVINRGGTAAAPLRLMADQVAENRVVLTGAVRSVREKKESTWERVDAALGLYRIPLAYKPVRVLANHADLLPYPGLEDLKALRFLADDYPGHKHGFAWDAKNKFLYVRLRADGKYGPTDPNVATMAVAPPTGGGRWGQGHTKPEDFLIELKLSGSAHVIIDGFTFETPGIAAVYTTANDLAVRNCWFFGCRSGVDGPDSAKPEGLVDRVTVEQCYVTHYPAFSDIDDTIHDEAARQLAKADKWQHLMHWQRKGGNLPKAGAEGVPYAYESGFTRRMGRDWIVRNNYFYEVFEGLSAGSTSTSNGARIYGNRFERICDNAVETEEHAQDIRIYNNLIIDTFEPFSWQPREGVPLPGPVYIYDNTVVQTPETVEMWSVMHSDGGLFKFGITTNRMWESGKMKDLPRNVTEAPGGFWAVHNTLVVGQGRAVTALNPVDRRYKGFIFLNNIVGTRKASNKKEPLAGTVFDYNFLASFTAELTPEEKALYAALAGAHGQFFATTAELGLMALPTGDLVPSKESPVNGKGLTSRQYQAADGVELSIPEVMPLRATPGALPFEAKVGPQPR